MGLFDKKESVSREELRGRIKRDSGAVGGGKKLSYAKRDRIAHDTLGSKKEGEISKNDYRKVVKDLELKKSRSSRTEKGRIEEKIKYLKQIGGIKRNL